MSDSGYYRFPAISGDAVYFTSEDDLWSVPARGGIARRLTSGLGSSSHPALSPDGRMASVQLQRGRDCGLMLMPTIIRDRQLNRLLLQTDTRTLARQWIEAHIPRRSRIAFTGGKMPFW